MKPHKYHNPTKWYPFKKQSLRPAQKAPIGIAM
jgi:hypothetical protein